MTLIQHVLYNHITDVQSPPFPILNIVNPLPLTGLNSPDDCHPSSPDFHQYPEDLLCLVKAAYDQIRTLGRQEDFLGVLKAIYSVVFLESIALYLFLDVGMFFRLRDIR